MEKKWRWGDIVNFSIFLFLGSLMLKSEFNYIMNKGTIKLDNFRRIIYVKDEEMQREIAESVIVDFLAQRERLPEGKVDLLMVLGSPDLLVPVKAAELYHKGIAEKVLISGGGTIGNETEARILRGIMIEQGVPAEAILIEEESKNTGQNMRKSIELLETIGFLPKSIVLLQRPFAQRTAKAAFVKYFPPEVKCYSFAPYVPDLNNISEEEKLQSYISILKEIYRLLTWGPDGKNRIAKVEVPQKIRKATGVMLKYLNQFILRQK